MNGGALELLETQAPARGGGTPAPMASPLPPLEAGAGEVAVASPMAGTIVTVGAAPGDAVAAGTALLVLRAMKMEAVVDAPCAGVVSEMQALKEGDAVTAGQVVALLTPAAGVEGAAPATDATWEPMLRDVAAMQRLALERLAPDSDDPGVVRQRSRGKLTCRERIDVLLDAGSFREVGSIAGFATYDEDGTVAAFTPANHVGGWGRIEGRSAIVCADDFTSRGGHADGAIGAKSGYLDRLALEMRVPSVRLLDGSSGGGSVAAMVPEQKREGESTAKESTGAIKAGPAPGRRGRRLVPARSTSAVPCTPNSSPPCPS